MMNIGEAARATGLPSKTIRYYEEIGLVPKAERATSGYRRYDQRAVQTLRFVHRARQLGFSVEACRGLVALWRDRHRSSAEVKALAMARIAEIDRKLRELQSMRATIGALADRCHGDQRPDCPILQDLAEG